MAGDRPEMYSTSGFHLPQELASVGRQRFDVAPLALGIDGVEGKRRLAAARQPGDDHQLVARKHEVDVLEVVLPRTADLDLVQRHLLQPLRKAYTPGTDVPSRQASLSIAA